MTWRPLTEAEKADYDRMLRARYVPPPAPVSESALPTWPHALALVLCIVAVIGANIACVPA